MRKLIAYALTLACFAGALSPAVRAADKTSITKTTKNYTITLKVLPAEAFTGKGAQVVWDGGAAPLSMLSSPKPNSLLAVFIEKNGKAVVDAKVQMTYTPIQKNSTMTLRLPVARMHTAGKGPETTLFGNNVMLAPGEYQINVTVNGTDFAVFRITV